MPPPERKRHVTAHRESRDDRAIDMQHVEQADEIVRVLVHGVGRGRGRFTKTAQVGCEAARLDRKALKLWRPQGPVVRKAVDEQPMTFTPRPAVSTMASANSRRLQAPVLTA